MRRWGMVLFVCCAVALAMSEEASSKPRVFVTDSQSWEMEGSSGGSAAAFGGHVKGGARPQTGEIIKTFGERCPDVTINNRKEKADYIVLLDHEGGKSLLRKDNKVAVFNGEGDSILSRSTRSLGNSVQDACNAIRADWPKRLAARVKDPSPSPAEEGKQPEFAGAKVQVSSDPAGADIEIDGSFVGSTPSEIELAAGEHSIVVKKTGYKAWERKIKTTAGAVNISAALQKQQ
jgi:PEGA domain